MRDVFPGVRTSGTPPDAKTISGTEALSRLTSWVQQQAATTAIIIRQNKDDVLKELQKVMRQFSPDKMCTESELRVAKTEVNIRAAELIAAHNNQRDDGELK